MEHDLEIKVLTDGEMVATCTCGWSKTVTEEKFAQPLWTRHMRLNLIPPFDNDNEWGPIE